MSKQHLWDVFVNVHDFQVVRGGLVSEHTARENTTRIQSAIATGRHLLFPRGTLTFWGVLTFHNAGQRAKFLAGAILQPYDAASYILITGEQQTFEGMRIKARTEREARSPLVEVYGASGLSMIELRVSVKLIAQSVSGPKAAVRLMGLTGARFIGGRLSGVAAKGTVGLWLAPSYDDDIADDPNPNPGEWNEFLNAASTAERAERQAVAQTSSGANEVTVRGLKILKFGWGVRVGTVCHHVRLFDCRLLNNVEGGVIVRDDFDVLSDPRTQLASVYLNGTTASPTTAVATGLSIMNCSFGGGEPPQYIHVQADTKGAGGGMIDGGAIVGCTFGVIDATPEGEDSAEDEDDGGPKGDMTGESAKGLAQSAPASAGPMGDSAGKVAEIRSPGKVVGLTVKSSASSSGAAKTGTAGASEGALTTTANAGKKSTRASASHAGGGTQVVSTRGVRKVDAASEPEAESLWNCIFRIDGSMRGVFVSGCRSEVEAGRPVTWLLLDGCSVLGSGDAFNAWSQDTIVSGDRADRLPRLTTESGTLAIHAHSVRFSSQYTGFYEDTTAQELSDPYTASDREDAGSRTLRSTSADPVLGQLLVDLAQFGLIRRWSIR